jgi:hypothetical protein
MYRRYLVCSARAHRMNFWANEMLEVQGGNNMNVRKSTCFAILGVSYLFVLRMIGTVFPEMFKQLLIVQITGILALLAYVTLIMFFISLYSTYVRSGDTRLKQAVILAIIGSTAMFLLQIKHLLPLVHVYIFHPLMTSHHLDAIIPWVSTLFFLLFFTMFYTHTRHRDQMKLHKAVRFAIIGHSIHIVLRTIVVWNYFSSREFLWFAELSRRMPIIVIPALILSFTMILYFFFSVMRLPYISGN